ncbi:hypothetical protein Tsubulata_031563 [Turnera subulata]|uniref:F-box domain-containing protein n=1 Tax=Turnera subulata TaxID=218843 RepID=A0A9Q0GJA4_9ROSI|nr:hypothetical protein Tsubulata_031563 [Turnera subulata]
MEMENCFPLDFVDEIVARLPNKSIMRFRCVSKEWSSYLVSDEFYKRRCLLRAERLLKVTSSGFYFVNYEKSFSSSVDDEDSVSDEDSFSDEDEDFVKDEDSLVPSAEQNFPFKKPNNFDLIGSCDGLVCLSITKSL